MENHKSFKEQDMTDSLQWSPIQYNALSEEASIVSTGNPSLIEHIRLPSPLQANGQLVGTTGVDSTQFENGAFFADDFSPLLSEDPFMNNMEFDENQNNNAIFPGGRHELKLNSHEFEDLLDMVDQVDVKLMSETSSAPENRTNSELSYHQVNQPHQPGQLAETLPYASNEMMASHAGACKTSSTEPILSVPVPSSGYPASSSREQQCFLVMNDTGQPVGQLKLLNHHLGTATSDISALEANCSGADDKCQRNLKPYDDTEDCLVSSTQPDFPANSGTIGRNQSVSETPTQPATGAQCSGTASHVAMNLDDPYFPLSTVEVMLMTPDARFMHLISRMQKEHPVQLRRFMLACLGYYPTNDCISENDIRELQVALDVVWVDDIRNVQRIITLSERSLSRHEKILKEMVRVRCNGDFSMWEDRLSCTMREHVGPSEFHNEELPEHGQNSEFGKTDQDDDASSVVSDGSDVDPDRLLFPQAHSYPEGPDLLRSNRVFAHPHVDSAVSDSVCETQFGKVKFSVYPGIRWGRDPHRKRKRLKKKLAESSLGWSNLFICDDLLDELDLDEPPEFLAEMLIQHNRRCPTAIEALHNMKRLEADRKVDSPATSHLVIRKLADVSPVMSADCGITPNQPAQWIDSVGGGRSFSAVTSTQAADVSHAQPVIVNCSEGVDVNGNTRSNALCVDVNNNTPRSNALFMSAAPTQAEMVCASSITKALLAQQTRELCQGGVLMAQASSGGTELGLRLLKRNNAFIQQSLQDASRPSNAAFTTASSSAPTSRHGSSTVQQTLLAGSSWQMPGSASGAPVATARKRPASPRKPALVSSASLSKAKKTAFSAGAVSADRPRVAPPVSGAALPTIFLHQLPVSMPTSLLRRKPVVSNSSYKPPLILPKPPSATLTSCRPREIRPAPPPPPVSVANVIDLSQLGSVINVPLLDVGVQTAVEGTGLMFVQQVEPMVHGQQRRMSGNARERHVTSQSSVKCGSVEGIDASISVPAGDQQVMHPNMDEAPSPKSLQARDKILKAMIALPEERAGVSILHQKPCQLPFQSLTIGAFCTSTAGAQRGRLKLVANSRKIVYEFELPASVPPVTTAEANYGQSTESPDTPAVGDSLSRAVSAIGRCHELCDVPGTSTAGNRESAAAGQSQTVAIEVKFSSVIGLQAIGAELSVVVSRVPLVLVSRCASDSPTGDDAGSEIPFIHPLLLTLARTHLTDSPMHQLTLSPQAHQSACRALSRLSQRFRGMLASPLHLDGYVPRWKLLTNGATHASIDGATAPKDAEADAAAGSAVSEHGAPVQNESDRRRHAVGISALTEGSSFYPGSSGRPVASVTATDFTSAVTSGVSSSPTITTPSGVRLGASAPHAEVPHAEVGALKAEPGLKASGLAPLVGNRSTSVTGGKISAEPKRSLEAWLKPNTTVKQSCDCKYSCRSLECACSRGSLPCGWSAGAVCACGTACDNTFNALREAGVDVRAARGDDCLVQSVVAVSKASDVSQLLQQQVPCPHCHLSVTVAAVVPLQRRCPRCVRPVVFSWCRRQLQSTRNHCLVCSGCSGPSFQHCLVCKSCTYRGQAGGPCSHCSRSSTGSGISVATVAPPASYIAAENKLIS